MVNTRLPYGAPLPSRGDVDTMRRVLTERAPVISAVHTGSVAHVPVVGVSVRVAPEGRAEYELTVVVAADVWRKVLREQHLPEDWIATLADRNGTFIARTHLHEELVGKPVSPALKEAVLSPQIHGTLTGFTVEGIEVRTGFAKLTASG